MPSAPRAAWAPFGYPVALTAAANHHTRQMGQLGFFEHESVNGAPFWRRIQRFYPARHGYWSVGENIFWESPDTRASTAVREWMHSPPHRQNILTASGARSASRPSTSQQHRVPSAAVRSRSSRLISASDGKGSAPFRGYPVVGRL